MKRFSLLFMSLAIIANKSFSQNTFPSSGSAGIGTTAPKSSSILEVKSTTKGVLIPRMTKTQRDAIASPVQGLLIYQTNNSPGLYYYDGGWSAVSGKNANKSLNNLTAPTAVNVDLLPSTNNSINFGSGSLGWKDIYLTGKLYLDGSVFLNNSGTENTWVGATGNSANTGSYNTATGSNALHLNTSGSLNTANGSYALYSNTSGGSNTANGYAALYFNTTAVNNTATGWAALYSNTTGNANTATGYDALYSNTTGVSNAATGVYALKYNTGGSYNTADGVFSLNSNTSGYNNSAIGYGALYANISGIDNTAIGYEALYYNTGYSNVANGYQALFSNTTGNYNTATGWAALYSNTTAIDNTANGDQALFFNTTGSENTAIGYASLFSNTTGNYNTANGWTALYSNTTGYHNTANGYSSLYTNTAGFYNTAIGDVSDVDLSGSSYNTILGASAHVSGNDDVAIGYGSFTNVDDLALLGSTYTQQVGGYANWTNFSDGRFKTRVDENVKGLDFILRLRPVTYHMDVRGIYNLWGISPYGKEENKMTPAMKTRIDEAIKAKEDIRMSGFIAQEVEKAAQETGYDFDGVVKPAHSKDHYRLAYGEFVVPLVKAVQELDSSQKSEAGVMLSEVEARKSEVDSLQFAVYSLSAGLLAEQKENKDMKSVIMQLQSSIENQKSSMTDGFAKLEIQQSTPETLLLGQNIPNPFDNNTIIPFRIPTNCSDASIVISESGTGRIVRAIPISCSETHLAVDAGTLASGSYSYSLYVNGKLVDTKEMELIK